LVTIFGSVAADGVSVTTMAMRVHYPSPAAKSLTQRMHRSMFLYSQCWMYCRFG